MTEMTTTMKMKTIVTLVAFQRVVVAGKSMAVVLLVMSVVVLLVMLVVMLVVMLLAISMVMSRNALSAGWMEPCS
jgi:hypothetical protein